MGMKGRPRKVTRGTSEAYVSIGCMRYSTSGVGAAGSRDLVRSGPWCSFDVSLLLLLLSLFLAIACSTVSKDATPPVS
jgi:hypothetical protein